MRRGGRDQQTASRASRADPGDARHAESKLARVQSHVATPRHKRTHRPARRPSWAHATGKRTMFLPLRSSQDSSYSTISPSRSALPSLIDDTWQNKSSPPSAGLMKPNPRGFQRHASPLSRFLPPPPPRPRLRERLRLFLRSRERLRLLRPPERLRERPPPPPPPPPRLRLRERLFLQRRGPVSPCDGPAGEVCGETWARHALAHASQHHCGAQCSPLLRLRRLALCCLLALRCILLTIRHCSLRACHRGAVPEFTSPEKKIACWIVIARGCGEGRGEERRKVTLAGASFTMVATDITLWSDDRTFQENVDQLLVGIPAFGFLLAQYEFARRGRH